ncbi:MAG: redoxin family protein [Planctomycetaceae bacterium]|nr:redoxin family protein [Planctomycetaceae bacterium]
MALEEGISAPAFALADQNGKSVKLADLKGKNVVLFAYPRAMTPG